MVINKTNKRISIPKPTLKLYKTVVGNLIILYLVFLLNYLNVYFIECYNIIVYKIASIIN